MEGFRQDFGQPSNATNTTEWIVSEENQVNLRLCIVWYWILENDIQCIWLSSADLVIVGKLNTCTYARDSGLLVTGFLHNAVPKSLALCTCMFYCYLLTVVGLDCRQLLSWLSRRSSCGWRYVCCDRFGGSPSPPPRPSFPPLCCQHSRFSFRNEGCDSGTNLIKLWCWSDPIVST